MLIVSIEENLHELSSPVPVKNKKKYFKIMSDEIFTQSAKSYMSDYMCEAANH